jgi:hypothetical protein
MTHPITPPPELVQEWFLDAQRNQDPDVLCWMQATAARAAQWGADQELEACCALLELSDDNARGFLYSARRPEPPSLREQALLALSHLVKSADESMDTTEAAEYIRRALEQLDD